MPELRLCTADGCEREPVGWLIVTKGRRAWFRRRPRMYRAWCADHKYREFGAIMEFARESDGDA
jgi:hypothetical protein